MRTENREKEEQEDKVRKNKSIRTNASLATKKKNHNTNITLLVRNQKVDQTIML